MSSKNETSNKVIVVGAGFSGLLTCYFALKNNFNVELYEENKIGGLLTTEIENEVSSGLNPVEYAANGLLNFPMIQQISKDIAAKIIYSDKIKTKKRYFFSHENLTRWPLSFFQTFQALLYFLKTLLFFQLKPKNNETVEDYGCRVFGKNFTQNILLIALKGIYGKNTSELSASLIFKKKLVKAKHTISFDNGMEFFCNKLFQYLTSFTNFKFINDKFELSSQQNHPIIFCTNARSASELLYSSQPEVSKLLSQIEYESTLTVTLQLTKGKTKIEGFGCLNSSHDDTSFLGILFNHCIYPERYSRQSFTLIYSVDPQHFASLTEENILAQSKKDLESVLNLRLSKVDIELFRFKYWPVSFPKYNVRLESILQKLDSITLNSNVYLNSNYLGHIGLSQLCQQSFLTVEKIKQSYTKRKI